MNPRGDVTKDTKQKEREKVEMKLKPTSSPSPDSPPLQFHRLPTKQICFLPHVSAGPQLLRDLRFGYFFLSCTRLDVHQLCRSYSFPGTGRCLPLFCMMLRESDLDRLNSNLSTFSSESKRQNDNLQELLENFKNLLEDYSFLKSDYEEVKEGREKYKRQARGQV